MIKIEDLKNIKNVAEVEGLEIRNYCPIKEQEDLLGSVIDIVVRKDENGIFYQDFVRREISLVAMVLALYTNIELTDDDYLNYDIVKEFGFYNDLILHIDVDNLDKFEWLYNDMIDNKLKENSIEHVAVKSVHEIVDKIDNMMNHVNGMLDKGDPNKIAKYLSKGIEMIANKLPDMSDLNKIEALKGLKNHGVK